MHPNPLNSLLSHTTIPMILLCGHDCSIAVHIGFNLLYFLFPLFRTKSHQKMSTMSKQLVVVSSLNILQILSSPLKPVPVNSSHLPSLECETIYSLTAFELDSVLNTLLRTDITQKCVLSGVNWITVLSPD